MAVEPAVGPEPQLSDRDRRRLEILDSNFVTAVTAGDQGSALRALERALIARRDTYGLRHPRTSACAARLGVLYNQVASASHRTDPAGALEVLQKCERLTEPEGPVSDPLVRTRLRAAALSNMGCAYRAAGKPHSALQCLERSLRLATLTPQVAASAAASASASASAAESAKQGAGGWSDAAVRDDPLPGAVRDSASGHAAVLPSASLGDSDVYAVLTDQAATHLNLGTILGSLGRHKEAYAHCVEALQLVSDAGDAPQEYDELRSGFAREVPARTTLGAIALHNLAVEEEALGLVSRAQASYARAHQAAIAAAGVGSALARGIAAAGERAKKDMSSSAGSTNEAAAARAAGLPDPPLVNPTPRSLTNVPSRRAWGEGGSIGGGGSGGGSGGIGAYGYPAAGLAATSAGRSSDAALTRAALEFAASGPPPAGRDQNRDINGPAAAARKRPSSGAPSSGPRRGGGARTLRPSTAGGNTGHADASLFDMDGDDAGDGADGAGPVSLPHLSSEAGRAGRGVAGGGARRGIARRPHSSMGQLHSGGAGGAAVHESMPGMPTRPVSAANSGAMASVLRHYDGLFTDVLAQGSAQAQAQPQQQPQPQQRNLEGAAAAAGVAQAPGVHVPSTLARARGGGAHAGSGPHVAGGIGGVVVGGPAPPPRMRDLRGLATSVFPDSSTRADLSALVRDPSDYGARKRPATSSRTRGGAIDEDGADRPGARPRSRGRRTRAAGARPQSARPRGAASREEIEWISSGDEEYDPSAPNGFPDDPEAHDHHQHHGGAGGGAGGVGGGAAMTHKLGPIPPPLPDPADPAQRGAYALRCRPAYKGVKDDTRPLSGFHLPPGPDTDTHLSRDLGRYMAVLRADRSMELRLLTPPSVPPEIVGCVRVIQQAFRNYQNRKWWWRQQRHMEERRRAAEAADAERRAVGGTGTVEWDDESDEDEGGDGGPPPPLTLSGSALSSARGGLRGSSRSRKRKTNKLARHALLQIWKAGIAGRASDVAARVQDERAAGKILLPTPSGSEGTRIELEPRSRSSGAGSTRRGGRRGRGGVVGNGDGTSASDGEGSGSGGSDSHDTASAAYAAAAMRRRIWRRTRGSDLPKLVAGPAPPPFPNGQMTVSENVFPRRPIRPYVMRVDDTPASSGASRSGRRTRDGDDGDEASDDSGVWSDTAGAGGGREFPRDGSSGGRGPGTWGSPGALHRPGAAGEADDPPTWVHRVMQMQTEIRAALRKIRGLDEPLGAGNSSKIHERLEEIEHYHQMAKQRGVMEGTGDGGEAAAGGAGGAGGADPITIDRREDRGAGGDHSGASSGTEAEMARRKKEARSRAVAMRSAQRREREFDSARRSARNPHAGAEADLSSDVSTHTSDSFSGADQTRTVMRIAREQAREATRIAQLHSEGELGGSSGAAGPRAGKSAPRNAKSNDGAGGSLGGGGGGGDGGRNGGDSDEDARRGLDGKRVVVRDGQIGAHPDRDDFATEPEYWAHVQQLERRRAREREEALAAEERAAMERDEAARRRGGHGGPAAGRGLLFGHGQAGARKGGTAMAPGQRSQINEADWRKYSARLGKIRLIQRVARGYLARQYMRENLIHLRGERDERLRRDAAATVIQRACLRYLTQLRILERRVTAVIACQSSVRGWLARKNFTRLVDERNARAEMEQRRRARQDRAATVVQAAWRGHHTRATQPDRRRYLLAEIAGRRVAARRVQRAWRAFRAERAARREAARDALMERSALTIQRHSRGHLTRRSYPIQRRIVRVSDPAHLERVGGSLRHTYSAEERRAARRAITGPEDAAATTIQRTFRGHRGRREASVVRAAVDIQRVYRGYRGRMFAAEAASHLHAAAIVVQTAARGWLARAEVQRVREDVARRRRGAAIRMNAAVAIQRLVRGWLGRRRAAIARVEAAERAFAALEIQRVARGAQARREYRRLLERRWRVMSNAAGVIQRLFKGYKARKRAALRRNLQQRILRTPATTIGRVYVPLKRDEFSHEAFEDVDNEELHGVIFGAPGSSDVADAEGMPVRLFDEFMRATIRTGHNIVLAVAEAERVAHKVDEQLAFLDGHAARSAKPAGDAGGGRRRGPNLPGAALIGGDADDGASDPTQAGRVGRPDAEARGGESGSDDESPGGRDAEISERLRKQLFLSIEKADAVLYQIRANSDRRGLGTAAAFVGDVAHTDHEARAAEGHVHRTHLEQQRFASERRAALDPRNAGAAAGGADLGSGSPEDGAGAMSKLVGTRRTPRALAIQKAISDLQTKRGRQDSSRRLLSASSAAGAASSSSPFAPGAPDVADAGSGRLSPAAPAGEDLPLADEFRLIMDEQEEVERKIARDRAREEQAKLEWQERQLLEWRVMSTGALPPDRSADGGIGAAAGAARSASSSGSGSVKEPSAREQAIEIAALRKRYDAAEVARRDEERLQREEEERERLARIEAIRQEHEAIEREREERRRRELGIVSDDAASTTSVGSGSRTRSARPERGESSMRGSVDEAGSMSDRRPTRVKTLTSTSSLSSSHSETAGSISTGDESDGDHLSRSPSSGHQQQQQHLRQHQSHHSERTGSSSTWDSPPSASAPPPRSEQRPHVPPIQIGFDPSSGTGIDEADDVEERRRLTRADSIRRMNMSRARIQRTGSSLASSSSSAASTVTLSSDASSTTSQHRDPSARDPSHDGDAERAEGVPVDSSGHMTPRGANHSDLASSRGGEDSVDLSMSISDDDDDDGEEE